MAHRMETLFSFDTMDAPKYRLVRHSSLGAILFFWFVFIWSNFLNLGFQLILKNPLSLIDQI